MAAVLHAFCHPRVLESDCLTSFQWQAVWIDFAYAAWWCRRTDTIRYGAGHSLIPSYDRELLQKRPHVGRGLVQRRRQVASRSAFDVAHAVIAFQYYSACPPPRSLAIIPPLWCWSCVTLTIRTLRCGVGGPTPSWAHALRSGFSS